MDRPTRPLPGKPQVIAQAEASRGRLEPDYDLQVRMTGCDSIPDLDRVMRVQADFNWLVQREVEQGHMSQADGDDGMRNFVLYTMG